MKPESISKDKAKVKKLFKAVSDYAIANQSSAHFNWPDHLIDEALDKYNFYTDADFNAFIIYQSAADFVEILALGSHPSFRKQGLMQKLLFNFVQKNLNNGHTVSLEVHENNMSALNLYKKMGFGLIRTRKGYYRDGCSALVLQISPKL